MHELVQEVLERQRNEAKQSGQMPSVVEIGKHLVHKEALLPVMFHEIALAAEHCDRFFRTQWRVSIENGDFDDASMKSNEAFAEAIAQQLTARFPLLTVLLRKPQTVHFVITELADTDPSMVKRHGVLFESPGNPSYKRMDLLLSLDRAETLEGIVSTLPFFRRFFVRRRLRTEREPSRPGEPAPAKEGGKATLRPGEATREKDAAGRSAQRPPERRRPETVPVQRPKHKKPETVPVTRRRKPDEPKSIDEAVDSLKKALSKTRRR